MILRNQNHDAHNEFNHNNSNYITGQASFNQDDNNTTNHSFKHVQRIYKTKPSDNIKKNFQYNLKNNTGLTNGLRLEKSDHNKITSIQKTIINSGLNTVLGLVDGNGLTNGNGLTIKYLTKTNSETQIVRRKNRVHQIANQNKRKNIIKAMIVIFLILLPLSLYFIELHSKSETIQIDGEFDDWNDDQIIQIQDTDPEPVQNPSTNLKDCRVLLDKNKLDFYIQTEFDILGVKPARSTIKSEPELFSLNIFIDYDLSKTTGYLFSGLGADERIEVQGQDGGVTCANSYYFDNSRNHLDWNGWVANSQLNYAKEKFRLEGRHYLISGYMPDYSNPRLNPHDSSITHPSVVNDNLWHEKAPGDNENGQIGLLIQLQDNLGNQDHTDLIIASSTNPKPCHKIEIIDLSPDNISWGQSEVPIVGFEVSPNTNIVGQQNEPLDILSISWKFQVSEPLGSSKGYDSSEEFGEFRLYADLNSNNILDENDCEVPSYCIDLNPQLDFDTQILQIKFNPPLTVDYNSPDKLNKFILTFQPQSDQLRDSTQFMQFSLQPDLIIASQDVITKVPKKSNQQAVMYLGEVPDKIIIDGIFADWMKTPDNEVLIDLDLPFLQEGNRDQDIYEIDVSMDLKNNALSCYLSVFGDLLVGATVPPIFRSDVVDVKVPNKSSDKNKVTTELNPINSSNVLQLLPRELLGEDKISIFLDTDQNPKTGYQPIWLECGAEYMIQISGKDGRIITHEIMKYSNNPSEIGTIAQIFDDYTQWQTLAEIPAAKNLKQLETQINWPELGIQQNGPMDLEFIISDWTDNKIDSTSTLTTTTNGGVKYQSGSQASAPILFDPDNGPISESNNYSEIGSEVQETNENFVASTTDTQIELGSRGIFLNDTDTGGATYYPNQRKLVRDSDDYWYAFWSSDNKVHAKRSNNTAGTDWSCPTITLAGGSSPLISGFSGGAVYPSVAIYQYPTDISKNEIHLVFTRIVGTTYSLIYTKCTDITNNESFSDSNNWQRADGSLGFDVIEPKINFLSFPQDGVASIALDRFGEPHVVFQLQMAISDIQINYTKWNSTNKWHDGGPCAIEISPPGNNYRSPTIDIGYNDTIHLVYRNITAGLSSIVYRQCSNIQNSMTKSAWKNTVKSAMEDVALQNSSGGHMQAPSLTCDPQGRVWITTHEASTLNNIWVVMEDFKDSTYWDKKQKIAEYGNNINPTIGYDSTGNVYCIWQFENGGDNQIHLSYNDSGSWSTPTVVELGGDYIYPQIPKNITGSDNVVGYIFKNNSADELLFTSIPELPDFAKFVILFLFIQVFIMINIRTTGAQTKFKNKWIQRIKSKRGVKN